MEFRKTVKLELEDQLSLSFYAAKKQLILMPVLIVVLSLAAALVMNIDTGIDVSLVVTTLVIALLFSAIIVFSLKHNARKQFISHRALQSPNDIALDGEGVHVTSERGNANYFWSDIYKAGEAKASYFIFISKAQAFIIPKRLLAPGEEETLRALLQQNVSPKMCRFQRRG